MVEMKPNGASEKKLNGNLAFIKEVAKYFMDFLETDFHKRKTPRRSVKLRNNDNLLIGVNLSKYPAFVKKVYDAVNNSFDGGAETNVTRGVYRTNLPKNLLSLIQLQISKIESSDVNETLSKVADEIQKAATLHAAEHDRAESLALEATLRAIKDNLVLPFVRSVEKPIENLGMGDENDIFLIEEELSEILSKLLEGKVTEVLNRIIAGENPNIVRTLKPVFDIEEIKESISNYFEGLQVGDLFGELFEISRNKAILDKQDFYLYFCDITFNKAKYPIFYIPFTAVQHDESFTLTFDSQVYINKRALEYIVQEYNEQKGTRGNLKNIVNRIINISEHRDDLPLMLAKIVQEIGNLFEVDQSIDLRRCQPQQARSLLVSISNATYMALFDKSDEALVNDYEQILQELNTGNGRLADIFNILIGDFIHNNPTSFSPVVEKDWDESDIPSKLVSTSPIPLNSEQLQILSAIRREGCKYIIVEGPPGTGKSHTITAISFDAILNHKSVLILSDKKEALDVVEDKITETMNKVRFGEQDFQNPILRLGKIGNTYSQILAKGTLEKIKTHHRAVNKGIGLLEESITKQQNSLKEDIEAEIIAYGNVDISQIHDFLDLDGFYQEHKFPFDLKEILANAHEISFLEEFRAFLKTLPEIFKDNEIATGLDITFSKYNSPSDLYLAFKTIYSLGATLKGITSRYNDKLSFAYEFKVFSDGKLVRLKYFLDEFKKAKLPIVGYLFTRARIEKLNSEFKSEFPFVRYEQPHLANTELVSAIEIFDHLVSIKEQGFDVSLGAYDYLASALPIVANSDGILRFCDVASKLEDQMRRMEQGALLYPKSLLQVGIAPNRFCTWLDNQLTKISDVDFERAMGYVALKKSLESNFSAIPHLNYARQKKQIEELVTTKLTHLLDTRLIDFYNNNKNDAETLRNIIKRKMRFPKEQFAKLKDAFPCILAGIRDYAEYIPLEPEIFDLVIIDEASQVSIAQAFPAIIRAKQVLILGDRKQFSNVKSGQARTETNLEYLNSISEVFRREVAMDGSKDVKLKKFDIKTSILEFFEFISNYNTQLMKHFRGYKELISYSNKYFYGDSLQVMKIRGKHIDEVIKFTYVENPQIELILNTNRAEIETIIAELRALKETKSAASIGIITPHTNQQKLLIEEISKLPERDFYFNELNLKIMTFDTCQGEERDIIYYSMVANETSDKLWGVFIKNLESIDSEDDGKIKAQRLNVGFSRAKERIHFVLSKPLDKFQGAVGDALRHFHYTLEEAKKEKLPDAVDPRSAKEPEVLSWFYQTEFWRKNKVRIEFLPQFEIGKYLRQLDRTYQHPNYKVDFLIVYTDEVHKIHKVIIEYDGFSEHFKDADNVNAFNYEHYLSEDDVYRQKTLESYGYKFLRINRFNVGDLPPLTGRFSVRVLAGG